MSDSVTGAEADIGQLVAGRYRLLERIGRGGMGTVWRAEDELLGRQVAVKRVHAPLHLSDEEIATLHERTRREARSAARITHPDVVTIHDVVEDAGAPCIVMEYVPSSTLGELLKRQGTLSPGEAARIGCRMIAALRAAHAAGVLHRDVKPANVLLGANGRVVLTDFGVAQSIGTSTLTRTGELVGSVDYLPPERVRGGSPSPASDLWALGATLYQALEGRPPFAKDTAVETAYAIVVDPLEPPRHAGPLAELIETLLAKEPEHRPTAEVVERSLRELAAEVRTPGITESTVPQSAPASMPEASPAPATRTTTPSPTVAVAGREPQPPTASAPERAPQPRAKAKGSGHRGRAFLLGALVVVLAAGGGYFLLARGGAAQRTANPAPTSQEIKPTQSEPPTAHGTAPSVPQGYHLVKEDQLGGSFPVPDGWQRQVKSGTEIQYLKPDGLVGLTIDTLDFASATPLQHWQQIEPQVKGKLSDYKLLSMTDTTYLGQPAAVWEFTFQGRARQFRAIDLGFGHKGGNEHAIYLSAPSADWNRYRPIYDTVRDGFRESGQGY
ncbi:protein kinase domain-containing protein [Streptantibioticus ferralitis]|uniref:non-specific serine/threonine protein kinase n=1 Tax=Streptantibioticus ferralitis TaxID=236510 RepID=A0ABT5YYS1_9ACTN|nr:serine/threonine-protein kinase [Streptantibioticus ferralitis]MDF2256746.1 protein kinase [Streptantibioticus ferralitis]